MNYQDAEKLIFTGSQKGLDSGHPQTGSPPRRGGTEGCLLSEETSRNEAFIEVCRKDEG
jgi:hypothetical protein